MAVAAQRTLARAPALAAGGPRVGVVDWPGGTGISHALADTLADAGCAVRHQGWREALLPDIDLLLACGPFGSLAPLGRQLAALPAGQRPRLAVWITEQFPNPAIPEPLQFALGSLRSRLERAAFVRRGNGSWQARRGLAWLTGRAHRFRYYGDLHWLRQSGLLDLVVVGSPVVAAWLRRNGFDPLNLVIGVHPSWGADLGLERDIPVLWLGKPGTRRRANLMARLRADLRQRGVELMVVDGVEHPYVFGEERTRLLNRTRILANLLRESWDNNGMRFFLGAVNGVMIASEPTLGHTPFVPGVHMVETPMPRLADAICRCLDDEAERARIAANAYRLATQEHTMALGVARMLARALAVTRA